MSIFGICLILKHLNRMENRIMTALADLQAADKLEASALVTVSQAITDLATRVTALQATLTNDPDDAAIEAVAIDLGTHASNLSQIATALAAIAPATVVTPPSPDLAATTTELSVPSTAVAVDAIINFSLTVEQIPAGAIPTGTVTVTDGTGATIGSATLDSIGDAVIPSPDGYSAGTYSFTAAYNGDTANAASTSAAVSIVVS